MTFAGFPVLVDLATSVVTGGNSKCSSVLVEHRSDFMLYMAQVVFYTTTEYSKAGYLAEELEVCSSFLFH